MDSCHYAPCIPSTLYCFLCKFTSRTNEDASSAIHDAWYLLKYHILSYRIFWSWSISWCAGMKMYLHKNTCFKLIKSGSKNIYHVTKPIFQINVELPIHQRIMKKNLSQFPQKIWSSTTVFNIDNNQKCILSSKSAYYYDFWRSCDTEDWSNDAENTTLHIRN